jgi:DNA-binding response OmpR family regulator
VQTVFVVDDDQNIRKLMKQYLLKEGFVAEAFASVAEVEERLKSGLPDLFVLDIMLPGEDGLAFCRRLRARENVPVVFVSARGDEMDRVLGLELGGDDYLAKPFSPRELVARVKAVLRRAGAGAAERPAAGVIEARGLRIIPDRRQVLAGGQEIDFTAKEYDLLFLLARNPGKVYSREQLLDQVWGFDYVGDIRAVDDLVKRVRRKLREKSSPAAIATVWGLGYKLED